MVEIVWKQKSFQNGKLWILSTACTHYRSIKLEIKIQTSVTKTFRRYENRLHKARHIHVHWTTHVLTID